MTSTLRSPIVVIGGGIAGLTAAALLGRTGTPTVVLEKASAAGGRAATHERHGFLFNLRPHALQALEAHDVGAVEALLADDVRTTTDGGGAYRAALKIIAGRDNVTRFYLAVSGNAANATIRMPALNGVPSAIVDVPAPGPGIAPRFTITAELNADGRIAHLYVISAPPKLSTIR